MNKKTVFTLILLAIIILTGAPTALAKQSYLTNLTEVYGNGSCETCHNNGKSDGQRTSYGMLFENQSNHVANASAALLAIGAPTAITPTVTTKVTEETPEETESQEEIPAATEAAKSPGFGILASLVGLFAWALLAKRNNK
ncbi:MAG: hypothetical protein C3F06_07020 [Candidatus Methanoperedenaceae archaeon]|nr:MAG: hypothetical protein C3F06_07020 [Candidatus Methanoperedenaceae archaeon]